MSAPLRIGTRGSTLARTQTGTVAQAIETTLDCRVDLVTIRTDGDDLRLTLHDAPRPGVFVSALRDALLRGEVDVIVHSFKDLPTAPAPGIALAAVPRREDPRDVLVCRSATSLADLPVGAHVGTSSPRRAAFLWRTRNDLAVSPVRGNVDTRLTKVQEGQYDALMLAAAGLHRIGRADVITEYLPIEQCVPAPAQGTLAVECRAEDVNLLEMLAALTDTDAFAAAHAERAVLAGVAATCATALGAHLVDGVLHADLATQSGYARVAVPMTETPVATGRTAAVQLLEALDAPA